MNIDEETCDSGASSEFSDDGIVLEEPVVVNGHKDQLEDGFQVVETEEVAGEMKKIIDDVAGIVHLPPTVCRLLLHHFQWNKESLLERFYEASDLDAFFTEANMISPLNVSMNADVNEESTGFCAICLDQARLTGLSCKHLFCYQCWDTYLSTKVVDEGRAYIACPQMGCPITVDDAKALKLISTETTKRSYRRLIINSFVECNRSLRWCPGADCGRVLKSTVSEPRAAKCKCGTEFCFSCGHEWHEPVNCDLLRAWLKKCKDDSETGNWISANTKDCPRCRATIEKDGGCNHVTCKNSACKMEFCWVCLGPWKPHGNSWYSCNRFDDSLSKKARDVQEKSRADLQRYLHYYNRYMNHQHSLKLEHKLYNKVDKKMEVMQQSGMSWIEVQFLHKAVDVLSLCRKTLMYTYAFAFYLISDNQSLIFEDNQRDLEHATEQLSEFLERDLDSENLVSLKQKVQDKCWYVEQRRDALLKHCAEGFEHDFWKIVS